MMIHPTPTLLAFIKAREPVDLDRKWIRRACRNDLNLHDLVTNLVCNYYGFSFYHRMVFLLSPLKGTYLQVEPLECALELVREQLKTRTTPERLALQAKQIMEDFGGEIDLENLIAYHLSNMNESEKQNMWIAVETEVLQRKKTASNPNLGAAWKGFPTCQKIDEAFVNLEFL
jgi:hypothetical protein